VSKKRRTNDEETSFERVVRSLIEESIAYRVALLPEQTLGSWNREDLSGILKKDIGDQIVKGKPACVFDTKAAL
jgi:hypothetical protein